MKPYTCTCGSDKDVCVYCMEEYIEYTKDYIRLYKDNMVESYVLGFWQGRTDCINGDYPKPYERANEYFK